ncbi:HEPN domain-containing protein [Methylobacterium sp. WL2]|uniref:HEPN domain-containing protein n=1 Tax=Methylobacterium sp. WL2 TaxID=2603902 RepID=UPI0011CA1076|nr:HEPN domain-containing protein [Methylobacterium sp. WL2]TXN50125.1 HEPN domain-containing protein [Methylobacterium sp. WL2]
MTDKGIPISASDVDEDTGVTAFKEFMRLWFDPEYERRIAAGTMQPGTVIMAAQAVFAKDKTIIRFNSEIRGEAMVRADRAIRKGEQVSWHDFQGLQTFELVPEEVDYGHVTLFRIGDDWKCHFNFLRGRSRADALAVRAGNFLKAAKNAHENGWHDVAVDNLFSASELLAKANLIVHMQHGAEAKTHDPVKSAINQWGRLGNVEAEFVKLFNKLGDLRHIARYEVSDMSRLEQSADAFDVVAAQLVAIRDLCDHELRSEQRPPVRITGILADPER